LAKRALESIILVSSNSNSTCIPFTCFASNMLKTFSWIWFHCKHVDDFCATCHNHAPMILNIDALCVAIYMLNNFSFFCFVCNWWHVDDCPVGSPKRKVWWAQQQVFPQYETKVYRTSRRKNQLPKVDAHWLGDNSGQFIYGALSGA
jgi:hypothetical protein